ncbi:putative MFS siderophore iron transporter [Aspergillus heteromorphus CBS 117.55]|uniref:Putative MFS siderophore iron transporter n=1 Tax=Aspergillus heteromorphus CBS 117.55 TaxID=1448321 RepID=A0A317V6R2_9EURO|nr:putative MFS siderophore iron transporter [Aspergillus heteromorphus CBS 117.55]PWY69776.1 putative MFS siderophore iron transporter [Aspergillus heteromorphus CBS 117.55]
MGLTNPFSRQTTDNTVTQIDVNLTEDEKRAPSDVAIAESNGDGKGELPETPEEELQPGVRDMEAMTKNWSKWSLCAVFLNIWMLYFTNAFQSEILASLLPYVSSAWEAHSLLNTIYIVADAITAACYVPVGKMMDLWGRAEGFLFMTICATIGLIMMAACNNLATFCAAYVFYSLGFGGMTYCVDVITADASMLKSRGLAYAFTSSPYIITAFAGPKAADDALGANGIGMRWPFGIFAIILPIVAAPLYGVLKWNIRQAQKAGTYVKEKSGRTMLQSIWFYIIEFDAAGVFLFSAGLVLFFLPFDIAGAAPSSWDTPYIIVMLVIGFVLLFVFLIYEKWFAPKPLFQLGFLYNRTVMGACLLDATYQLCYYCWDNYFTSFLQVVNDLSVADAGYVGNTFDVVSGVLLILVGIAIRKTGRFKWTLWVAVPLYIFAQGLMIYFRRPNQSVGYLVMCQVFISIGGSVFIIVEQLSILAAVDHQHFAAALALLNVVGTVGDGMGATISSAIWQNTYPNALRMYLPESAMDNFYNIYEDIDTQLSYPVGSETRIAIQRAYGYAQTRMLAVGTGIMVLAFIWTMMIKNIDLKKVPQVKGVVF